MSQVSRRAPIAAAMAVVMALAPLTPAAGAPRPVSTSVRPGPATEDNLQARRLQFRGTIRADRRLEWAGRARRASRRLLRRSGATPLHPLGASPGIHLAGQRRHQFALRAPVGGMHTGIDIDGDLGRPVGAAKAGWVARASDFGGYGTTVTIDHGGSLSTTYSHLSAISVELGDHVARGEVIGRIGCTGNCTGNHLHFEVQRAGVPFKPMRFLP